MFGEPPGNISDECQNRLKTLPPRAMAMTRAAYAKYAVAQLWVENVVDDCSLSALLQVRGAKVRLCPGALLHTDAVNHSLPVWRA